jgi:hypothetical protein
MIITLNGNEDTNKWQVLNNYFDRWLRDSCKKKKKSRNKQFWVLSLSVCETSFRFRLSGTRRSLLHRLSNGRAAKAKEEVDILFCFFKREGERPDVLRWKKSHRLSIFLFFFPVASHIFCIVIKLIFRTHEKGDDDMRTRIGELLFWNLIFFFFPF